jgi:MOSC domain-containing protein YiiM
MKDLKTLQSTHAKPGKVVFISVRPKRREPVIPVQNALAIAGEGLENDRYNNVGGSRQVTLVQGEHLRAIASILGREVRAEDIRRNIVVEGINLAGLKGHRFQIGEAILEYSGECHPCSRMEENLGPGGYNAMRGHGGITARVIQGGVISVGDLVCAVEK